MLRLEKSDARKVGRGNSGSRGGDHLGDGWQIGELRIREFERFESWSDGVCKIRRSIAQITPPATLAR